MKHFFSVFLLVASFSSIYAQNMGVKMTAGAMPNTTLDVNGAASLREGTALTLANGVNNDINLSTEYSFYRLTGPTTAFNITGFTNGVDGRILTVVNASTQTMSIGNATGSTAANQTITSGLAFSVPPNGSASFQYNATLSKWVLTGTTGAASTTTYIVKAADESVTNSTTVQADNDFLFTVEANKTYIIEGSLAMGTSSPAAAGIKISMNYPSGSTMMLYGSTPFYGNVFSIANAGFGGYFFSDPMSLNNVVLKGVLRVGSTSGTASLQWAQMSANATATTLTSFSFMSMTKTN